MLNFLNKSHENINSIALILASMSVLGFAISFIRDRVFAHFFGVSGNLDVFIASFIMPDLLYITATAFLSIFALLPSFEEARKKGVEQLKNFINTAFYFLVVFLIISGTLLFFFIPIIGEALFVDNFSPETYKQFIFFSKILLIQAILFSLTSFFIAILQYKRKFLLYSLLPIIYNSGIIIGVVLIYPIYGNIGFIVGVLFGVFVSVIFQLLIIAKSNCIPYLLPKKDQIPQFIQTVKNSIPRALALLSISVTKIFIFSFIVSISSGILSVYYFAENIKSIPLVVIGTAFSVATFPTLVKYISNGNYEKFKSVIEDSFRKLIFFIIPIISFIFILREELVSFFFETGAFDSNAVFTTSVMVGIFVFGAISTSVLILSARTFYAYGKSMVPFIIFLTLSITQILSIKFSINFLQSNNKIIEIIQTHTNLSSGEYGILLVVVGIIVILETLAAIVMIYILSRYIKQKLLPLFIYFIQNIIASGVFMIPIILFRETLFVNLEFNSFKGISSIILMGFVGLVFWYIFMCLIKIKEINILKVKLLSIRNKIWKI